MTGRDWLSTDLASVATFVGERRKTFDLCGPASERAAGGATSPCQPMVAGAGTPRGLAALVLLGACAPSAFDDLRATARMDAGSDSTYADAEPGSSSEPPWAETGTEGGQDGVLVHAGANPAPDDDTQPPNPAGAGDGGMPSVVSLDGGSERRDAQSADANGEDAAEALVGESACYDRFESRLACIGFESDLSAAWWRIETSGEVVSSAERVYVGEGALHASSQGAGSTAFVGHAAFPLVTSGSLYLRSYIYVPSGVALEGVIVHGLSEERDPYGGVSLLLSDHGLEVDVHPDGPGVSPIFIESMQALPRDRWNCLQLQVTVSEDSGAVRLSLNGELIAASATPLATLPASAYRGVSAGLVYADPSQGPVELFVDELVADVMPIPCD